ncbi:MAG: 5-bromo-4-chloroindolyl phosphate hydrolysis family protein [Syntrophobacteraceae bacterium]
MAGRILSSSLSGIVGGLLFLLFHLYLGLAFWLSAGSAIAGFVGMTLILDPLLAPRRIAITNGGNNTDYASLEKVLAQGDAGIREMRSLASKIDNRTVRDKVEAICAAADRIVQGVAKDPKDIRLARKFFTYYLDAARKIVSRYIDISHQNLSDPNIVKTLGKVEETLDSIRALFEKQLARMFEDDMIDLDAEMELLEKTIRMEGL